MASMSDMPNMTRHVMPVGPGHPDYSLKTLFRPRKCHSKPENSPVFQVFIHQINYLSWSDPRMGRGSKRVYQVGGCSDEPLRGPFSQPPRSQEKNAISC